jgi:hypothetical protein
VPYVMRFAYGWSRFVNFDFSITTISLRQCSLHVFSILTVEHVSSRMVMPSHALSRITICYVF